MKTKKITAVLLASAMLLSLSACGGTTESTESAGGEETTGTVEAEESAETEAENGPDNVDLQELAANYDGEIHVTIWGKDSIGELPESRGAIFADLAQQYSAQFDNVTVEYIYQGGYNDVREKVMAAAAAGDLPTMFMTEESMVLGFESIAVDLRDCIPSAIIDNYQDGLLISMRGENDALLGAPCARSLPVLYVNKELLAEAGWEGSDIKNNEDLMQCAKDVYEATGVYGYGAFWDSDCWHWESAIYADGGAVLSDDGSMPTIGADYDYVGAKFVNLIKEGLTEGWIYSPYTSPEPDSDLDDKFCSGEVAMMIRSCNSMPGRANRSAENGYTMETYVQPAGEGGVSITGGGSNWVICNTASYEEQMIAGGFLAYLAQDENIMRITKNTGSMMITESAMASEAGVALLEEYPYFQSTYDSIPYLHTRPNTPYWAEMYTYTIDKLEQFSLYPEDTDVEAMIDDIETKYQQIIDDNEW